MFDFKELCLYTGINLDEQLEAFYKKFCNRKPELPLIKKSFISECSKRFALAENLEKRLLNAVDEIEADEKLHFLSLFLRNDMCDARHRCDLDDYHAMTPSVMKEKELYSFIMLMSCVEPSIERVKKLGIPKELYEDIPFNPLKRQMESFAKTQDGSVKDFPWDMNFYTCSIFLMDRFYFIPFKLDDNIVVYKNNKSGEIVAAFAESVGYRADGLLSGTNDDNSEIGKTVYSEDETSVTITPINPCGVLQNEIRMLLKSEWSLVLQRNDILLGFHIPGGAGYDPQHLSSSICAAKELFEEYFPEVHFKGYGSESWLYDPHMRIMLSDESNIMKMQNRMYIYPLTSGDGMMYGELFGGKKPADELKEETTLQRKAKEYIKKGGRFAAAGMFILKEDSEKVKDEGYSTKKHIAEALGCFGGNL